MSSGTGNQEHADNLNSLKRLLELQGRMCAILKHQISEIEHLLFMNQEKQESLRGIFNEDQRQKKKSKEASTVHRAMLVFAAPYFQDVKKMVPPPNKDTVIKRKNPVDAYLTLPRPWISAEYKKLLDGVTTYARSSALQPLQKERDHIKRKMNDNSVTDENLEDLNDDLYIVEQKIRLVNRKPLHELIEQLNGNIDWMAVSATNMHGDRTPEECEIMWNNYLSFNINKKAFSKDEDAKLTDLADDYNERNWDLIAAALKTNRTAIQCFERYQTKLNLNLKKKYWTKEEDDRLIELVEKYRYGEIICWNKISLLMEGHTREQIVRRYERSILQRCHRGPWSSEEDGLLIGLYQKYGSHWINMKCYFKQRSTDALRERFDNALRPNIRASPWSQEEDKLLISMIKKYGYGRWTKIAKQVPGRTDNVCSKRARLLLKWSVEYHSERGTGEYDPGVNDPETFAKILRPFPPSKYRRKKDEKLSSQELRIYRENGLKKLSKALETVAPEYKAGIQDFNSIDVSWMSSEMFHQLSEVLYAHLGENKKEKKYSIPLQKYITKPPLLTKRKEPDWDESDYYQPLEKKISAEEKDLIDSALHIMFEKQSNIMQTPVRKTKEHTSRQWTEMSLYKAYLYKEFHCKTFCDQDDNLEDVVFDKIDYSRTLHTVVSYFIQPPVYDNQFLILTPNLTIMTGMETMEACENRLEAMAKYVHHSKPYVNYLCEKRKGCPECLQCLFRSGRISCEATSESVMSDMKKKSFLLDERQENSAFIEGASVKRLSDSCVCKALADSQNSVRLLRKRFLSLFLWPILFSAVGFSEEQEHIISEERAKKNDCFFNLSSFPMERFKQKCLKRKRTHEKQRMS